MRTRFTLLLIAAVCVQAFTQLDGARTYWPLPKNMNILSGHFINAKVNASANNLTFINPSITIDNDLYMLTYTRSQPLLGRTFYSTLILPAGNITATINVDPQGPATSSSTIFQHGFGDIVWSNTINLIGAKGLMIKDFVRHETPTIVYLQAAVVFPSGNYDPEELINIGSNQYKLKLGLPIVQRIGPLVDGKRMSVEVFPAFTLISNNDDFQGQEVEQKSVFSLEAHLTKDVTRKAFISLDYAYINGGDAEFVSANGEVVNEQEGQNAHLFGATLNFNINDYLNLFLTHNQTISSGSDDVSLDGTVTKITLSWAFHDFQEKFKSYMDSN